MRHDSVVRARCAEIVAELTIPRPFDVAVFCEQLGRERGRPIYLLPMDLRPGMPTGLLVVMDDADYVVHEQRTGPRHRDLIVLHEVGHYALEQAGLTGEHRHDREPLLSAEAAQLLMPHLDPAMVQRLLGRTAYSDEEERAAEYFASLVLQRARQPAPRKWVAIGDRAQVISRVEGSLGGHSGGRRGV